MKSIGGSIGVLFFMSNNKIVASHIKQGDAYKKSGDFNSAISEYQKALKIEPASIEALIKLAQTYEIKGDQEKEPAFYILAQEACEKAIAKEPSNSEIHNLVIALGVKQGRIDELVKYYEKKLQKNPGNQALIKAVKDLEVISLVSIPSQTSDIKTKGGCSKFLLDFVFPFSGTACFLFGLMLPKLKGLLPLGAMMLTIYLIYKFLYVIKSVKSKHKKW